MRARNDQVRTTTRHATAINVTLCAPTEDELAWAISVMQVRHMPDMVFAKPRMGRYGAWVCDGTLFMRQARKERP